MPPQTPEFLTKKAETKLQKTYRISSDIAVVTALTVAFGPSIYDVSGFFGNVLLDNVTGQSFAHPKTHKAPNWDSGSTTKGENVSEKCSQGLKYTDYQYMIKARVFDNMTVADKKNLET